MNNERQVLFSKKGKSESSLHHPLHAPPSSKPLTKPKPCKKSHCQGHEKQKQPTSRFHSEGKSQKPTKRKITKQKSQSKLVTLQAKGNGNEEVSQLRAELGELKGKYEAKKKEVGQLKEVVARYEKEIEQQDKLIRSWNKKVKGETNREKERESAGEVNKSVLSEAQTLTRQAVNKYKILSQQFQQYKLQSQNRLQKQRSKHQTLLSKLKEDYQSKLLRLQHSPSSSLKQHKSFKLKQQQALNQTDIKIYKQQIRKLRSENQELLTRIQQSQQQFRRKENEFKGNLIKITERVENWEVEDEKMRALEEENEELREGYEVMWRKYEGRKVRDREKTREWAGIFQEFLGQINRLKKQIEEAGSGRGMEGREDGSF